MYVCVRACMCTYVCMFCLYIYIYIYIYIHIHIHHVLLLIAAGVKDNSYLLSYLVMYRRNRTI